MKNTLFINSALSTKCVALIYDGNVFIEDTTGHKKDLENILEAAQDLCNEAGCKLADIDSVVVVRGPGNFSAIRVGCIVAMSLANNLPCELFAIDSLSLLAAIAGSDAVAMNASKTELYSLKDTDMGSAAGDTINSTDVSGKIVLEKAQLASYKDFDLVDFDERFVQERQVSLEAQQKLTLQDIEKFLKDLNFESFISEYKSSKIIEPLYIKPPNIHVKD